MRPFTYASAADAQSAVRSGATYLAGGTMLIDLMKLDVMRPERLVDINDLAQAHGAIVETESGLTLGALVRMAAAAEHPAVRDRYPVLREALTQAASPQLRNMASLGGNVLQRTRCSYFRDVTWVECNKRVPGSGCAALGGVNRRLAVLGVSDHCIAQYPGDFANALVALGAEVELRNPEGETRRIAVEDLHRLPGDTPQIETTLTPGELILAFHVPSGPWTRRSLYRKIRDRSSYDFALTSAAVALHLEDGVVVAARIGLGGVATKPWRAHAAEAALVGHRLDEDAAEAAASVAFAGAVTHGGNDFKPELGRRTLVRALLEAAAMEI